MSYRDELYDDLDYRREELRNEVQQFFVDGGDISERDVVDVLFSAGVLYDLINDVEYDNATHLRTLCDVGTWSDLMDMLDEYGISITSETALPSLVAKLREYLMTDVLYDFVSDNFDYLTSSGVQSSVRRSRSSRPAVVARRASAYRRSHCRSPRIR